MTPPAPGPEPIASDDARIIPLFADGERGESVNDAFRLDRAIKRVRRLLNDPVALQLRAQALLDGTARPLLVLAVVGLTALRMVGGPPSVPSYYMHGIQHRRSAIVAAVPFDSRRRELA